MVLIVFLIQPSWVNNSQGNQANILASFLLFPSQTLPLVVVGWTLIHEIYFYLVFLILIAALYGYHCYYNITGQIGPLGWWRILIFGIPTMFFVFCFTNAENIGYVIHSSLIKVGDASYSIYLSHIFTLSAVGRVWSMFSTNLAYDNVIMIPVLFVLVIMVGFISYFFVEKPLLKLCRRIA